MNCSPNICLALTLLSFTAGMWFLYKTQKENMGTLFKVAAWFVIIASLLNMACCGMRCMRHGHRERGEKGEFGMERMHRGGWDRDEERGRMPGGNYYTINSENCWVTGNEVEGKSTCEEGEECNENQCGDKEEMECKMKKDSVAVMKKGR